MDIASKHYNVIISERAADIGRENPYLKSYG